MDQVHGVACKAITHPNKALRSYGYILAYFSQLKGSSGKQIVAIFGFPSLVQLNFKVLHIYSV